MEIHPEAAAIILVYRQVDMKLIGTFALVGMCLKSLSRMQKYQSVNIKRYSYPERRVKLHVALSYLLCTDFTCLIVVPVQDSTEEMSVF